MADEFAGGPAAFGRAGFPLIGGNGVCGGQELLLSAVKVFEDTRERGHSLNFRTARVFEGVCELEDAGFAKGWAEDLQADRQFAIDFATGDGDAGDAS